MAIKSRHYLFTFKLHIFLVKNVLNRFFKLSYTHHFYSHILEASHLREQTLNIIDAHIGINDNYLDFLNTTFDS